MTLLGIDGASVAGLPDCDELANLGYRYGFPRQSFGHVKDKACSEYLRRLRAAGMLARTYSYLRSWEDGASQASFAIELARDHGSPFVWVDCEPAGYNDDGSYRHATDVPAFARTVLVAWLERAIEAGFPVGVYGGAHYLASLRLPEWCSTLPLWLAFYPKPSAPPDVRPPVPAPWTTYTIWQRRGDVRMAGAVVDINESPLTLEQLEHALSGEAWPGYLGERWTAPSDALAGVLATSAAAMGTDGGRERFSYRDEGPVIG